MAHVERPAVRRRFRHASIIVLGPIVIIACAGDEPSTDCVDQGAMCFFWGHGPYGAEGSYVQKHVACDGPPLTSEECPHRITKNPDGPFQGCCKARKCAGGRGSCNEPCPAEKVIIENDPECDWGGVAHGAPLLTPCCAP